MPCSDDISHLAEPHSLRVLVAEDNVVSQKVLLHLLKRLGHQVNLVSNGLEALKEFAAQRYDVVLMDLQMPEIDGFTAAQHIRQTSQSSCQSSIIAMVDNQGDRQACLDAGMDDCISKPIQLGELNQALSKCQTNGNDQPVTEASPVLHLEALQALREIAGGDSEVFLEIIATYLDDAPNLVQAIQEAIAQRQANELKRAAHTLKSISATLGAITLSEYCKELEMLAGADLVDSAQNCLPQLVNEYERVQLALETECQQR